MQITPKQLKVLELIKRGFTVSEDIAYKNYIGINCVYSIFIEKGRIYFISEHNECSKEHKTELSSEFMDDIRFLTDYVY